MKLFLKSFIPLFFTLFFTTYLILGFYSWELNPSYWDLVARKIFLMVMGIGTLIIMVSSSTFCGIK